MFPHFWTILTKPKKGESMSCFILQKIPVGPWLDTERLIADFNHLWFVAEELIMLESWICLWMTFCGCNSVMFCVVVGVGGGWCQSLDLWTFTTGFRVLRGDPSFLTLPAQWSRFFWALLSALFYQTGYDLHVSPPQCFHIPNKLGNESRDPSNICQMWAQKKSIIKPFAPMPFSVAPVQELRPEHGCGKVPKSR